MHKPLTLLCAVIAIAVSSQAQADKRVALVIGNSAYQNTVELKNPRHDAANIAAALVKLNFDVVDGRDLDKRSMERTIRQFGLNLVGSDIALFFYAGHGLQVGGQNYLLPTDARLASEGDLDFETLPLNLVLKQMERESKTSLVVLDACRDNPLVKNLARSMGTRSAYIGQGLAEVKTGVGTLIAFSTQPGSVALDGTGPNSPYTAALLKHIASPDKDVSSILVAVRNDVLKATGGSQVPWEHTSLTGQVYFVLPTPQTAVPGWKDPSSPPVYDKDMELAFWNAVKDSRSPALLQTYLDRFPAGNFAGLARVMMDQLRGDEDQKKAAQAPPAKAPEQPGKLASLPPTADRPKTAATDPSALARALQAELRRVGCEPGAADGRWGPKATDALEQFVRFTKLAVATEEPTEAALQALVGQKGRVCPLICSRGTSRINGRCVVTARPVRRIVERPARPRRADDGQGQAKSKGLCWKQDGRNFQVGPC